MSHFLVILYTNITSHCKKRNGMSITRHMMKKADLITHLLLNIKIGLFK